MNNNNGQHQQHRQKPCVDDEQGWCVVEFQLDTSDTPQVIKYPRGPPTLKTTTKEEVKKNFGLNTIKI